MNYTDALGRFLSIVQTDAYTADFCAGDVRWAEHRRADWDSNRIRVGVIGVTSSGKSTLINAILGKNILSSALVPTSSQLVSCSHGDRSEIVIRFENGTVKKLAEAEFTRENLMQYSDERYNCGNEKNVLSIELVTPSFDLGDDVLLVDSPGLDAFGLDAHERLTLESLVPTIDACIYVTTMKTNSDRKTMEILNTVARYNCPIIIVQNMLDSVRPSPDGRKSCEEVAYDHLTRVRRIVKESSIADKASVAIQQISAKLAEQWRSASAENPAPDMPDMTEEDYKKSNYTGFVESVREILAGQRPRIERQRLMCIRSRMEELAASARAKISSPTEPMPKEFPLAQLERRKNAFERDVIAKLEKIIKDYETACKKIKDAFDEPQQRSYWGIIRTKKSKSDLQELVDGTNAAVSEFAGSLADLIKEYNAFVESAAVQIKYTTRDLQGSAGGFTHSTVNVQEKTEKRTYSEKDPGVKGFFKRGAGKIFRNSSWGYHDVTEEVAVVDEEGTKAAVFDRLNEAYRRYINVLDGWYYKKFTVLMHIIDEEVADSKDSYNRKKNALVEADALRTLAEALEAFIGQIDREAPGMPDNNSDIPEPEFAAAAKTVEAPAYLSPLLQLSHAALRDQHRAITKSMIEAIHCEDFTPILIGWDSFSMEEFLWQTGIVFSEENRIVPSASFFGKFEQGSKCVFILVNTIQFGAARKQIHELNLNGWLTKDDFVVWVVQDFQELLTGDCAVQGLACMMDMKEEIPCKSIISIMHENPVYNLAFLEYQVNPQIGKVPNHLIHDIQHRFTVYTSEAKEKIIGDIITSIRIDSQNNGGETNAI